MNLTFLENLKKNNQFPVIFIGSGITKRYFKNAPNWDELLESIWNELNLQTTYYAKYNEFKHNNGDSFSIFTKLADELEEAYDKSFYEGKVTLSNLTPQQAHKENKSPFKHKIAEMFNDLELRDDVEDEVKLFKKMIQKARIIITTNYDTFVEDQFSNSIDVHVGNEGLFERSRELSELFKIHGSVRKPDSIVITEQDYGKAERNSTIVNAKILSYLTDSPIVFFGYSLTDKNIQSLLKDLAQNMPFNVIDVAKRIGIINYEKGKENITEVLQDSKFGVHYTKISTDNFAKVYSDIAEINQGMLPQEIIKYEGAFRKIIEEKGQQGKLQNVLTSFVDLNRLDDDLKDRNLVVAFGDERFIYKIPNFVDYAKAYFLEKNSMPLEIAWKFILSTPPASTIPIAKYLSKIDLTKLSQEQREKINNRLIKFKTIEDLNVMESDVKKQKFENLKIDNLDTLFQSNDLKKSRDVLTHVICCIDQYSKEQIYELIKYILENSNDALIKNTICRKLFMAYSILYEKTIDKI